MSAQTQWILFAVAGYLVGSIPVGLLLGRLRGTDLREHGSGNIGATNAMRVLGRRVGTICLILDVLKGLAPTLLAGWLTGSLGRADLPAQQAWAWLGVAACPVVGHIFPIWLRFRGGKGVATGLGSVLGVFPQLTIPALLATGTWLLAAKLTRYVGVSSCIAGLSVPVWAAIGAAVWTHDDGAWSRAAPFLIATGLLAALVLWRHRGNLIRTMQGVEPRIGDPLESANSTEPAGEPAQPARAAGTDPGSPPSA